MFSKAQIQQSDNFSKQRNQRHHSKGDTKKGIGQSRDNKPIVPQIPGQPWICRICIKEKAEKILWKTAKLNKAPRAVFN